MKELTTVETELVAGGFSPAAIIDGLLGDSFSNLGEFLGESGVSLAKDAVHAGLDLAGTVVKTGLDIIGGIFPSGSTEEE
ncbi:hypothetical protein R84981_001152 [Carnimonas sp. R-84981]|uniref:hypothetical protein n=1 Tax=Carnimonas bestiolae TaxID=3402172 RepID=UPI003EDB819C